MDDYDSKEEGICADMKIGALEDEIKRLKAGIEVNRVFADEEVRAFNRILAKRDAEIRRLRGWCDEAVALLQRLLGEGKLNSETLSVDEMRVLFDEFEKNAGSKREIKEFKQRQVEDFREYNKFRRQLMGMDDEYFLNWVRPEIRLLRWIIRKFGGK